MFVYIISTLISIFISIFIKLTIGFKKHKTFKMFISILPLTLVSAFRFDVGWDYINIYTNGFYYVGKYGLNWFSEPVFNIIIRLLYNFFNDPLSLFIFMSFMISLVFSMCYKVYGSSNIPYIYILLFLITRYYLCSLNIVRQALAMLIILYSIHFLEEGKIKAYFAGVIIASLFHMLALIYIPLYFILKKDFKRKINILLLIFCLPIFIIILLTFLKYTKYSKYFISMFGNDGSILFTELFINFIIVATGLIVYKNIRNSKRLTIFFNLSVIAMIISLLSFMLPTADRIVWYFSITNIFFIPELINCYSGKKTKFFITSMIYLSITTVFVFQTIIGDSYSVLPYKNIIEVRRNGG